MSLSREDMLRELELLPMWRQRVSAQLTPMASPVTEDATLQAAPDVVQAAAMQAIEIHVTETHVTETQGMLVHVSEPSQSTPVAPEVQATPAQALDAQRALDTQAVPLAPVISSSEHMNQAHHGQALFSPVALSPVAVSTAQTIAPPTLETAPVIGTPWLFYAPGATDAERQALLLNMVKAMHLPVEMRTLQLQPLTFAQAQVPFIVLFGLQQANQFLGTGYAALAQVRGQVLVHGTSSVVVTHALEDMRQNPACKKAVWQDLCGLLAKKD